jgi:hypothetical protein
MTTTSASQLCSPAIPNFCSTEQMSDERRLLIQSTQLVADWTSPSMLAFMTVHSGFYINLYPFMIRSNSFYIGMAYKATYKSLFGVNTSRISKTTTIAYPCIVAAVLRQPSETTNTYSLSLSLSCDPGETSWYSSSAIHKM